MDDPIKWLNLVLALVASVAAFGSLNKMQWGVTKPCLIGAMALIVVGMAGQWMSLVHEAWLPFIDTALYCGILGLILASQRVHTWVIERFSNPIATLAALLGGLVLLGGLLTGCTTVPPAPPQAQDTPIPVHVYDDGKVQMRLMPGPCVDVRSTAKLVASPLAGYIHRFKGIDSTWPMKDGSRKEYAGCWAEFEPGELGAPETVLVLVFEDGAALIVAKDEFLQTKKGGV